MQSGESAVGEAEQSIQLYPAPVISIAFAYGSGKAKVSFEGTDSIASPRASLGGNFLRPKKYSWESGYNVFSICFKPWGVRCFTRFPLSEATNQNLDLHYVFGNRVANMEERLSECSSPYERRHIVEAFLCSELRECRKDQLIVGAVEGIVGTRGGLQVQKMAEQYRLSRKQFARRFQETVGIPPKLFSRIVRFQHTLQLLSDPVRNIEVACESGYFDQAHFTKEFRELAGVSPGKFLSTIQRSKLGKDFDEIARMSPFYNTIYQ